MTGKGSLWVLEGLDGSGKATQAALLAAYISHNGQKCKQISFPDYEHSSSALVKSYLAGDFGSLREVNAYAASSFYAVDRYASYRCFWRQDYQAGAAVIADRYTTSNLPHQMVKLPREEWDGFIAWLEDYEYDKLGLPRPDGVIYLDMPPQASQALLRTRYGGDRSRWDLHERDTAYLRACREAALYAAQRLGWLQVACGDEKGPFAIEQIHRSVAALWSAGQGHARQEGLGE